MLFYPFIFFLSCSFSEHWPSPLNSLKNRIKDNYITTWQNNLNANKRILFEVPTQCAHNTERWTKRSGLNPHFKPKINLFGSFSACYNHGLINNWGDHINPINLKVIMKHLIILVTKQHNFLIKENVPLRLNLLHH